MLTEAYFNQENVYKWAKHGFPMTPESKRQSIEWKHIDSHVKKKKKVPGTMVSKGNVNSLLGHGKTIMFEILEKGALKNMCVCVCV